MPRQASGNSPVYIEVDRARTKTGRKCNHCGEQIKMGEKYLHMVRNSHLFVICGACLLLFTKEVVETDPTVKSNVVAKLL